MRLVLAALVLAALAVGTSSPALAQGRVPFGDQDLFLSGGNVAWVDFARDIGPGTTNLAAFGQAFDSVHDAGGNTMRLWLHTSGDSTPAWSGGRVTGPGDGTIADLRAILDLAQQKEVGLMLCLWSFDMLQSGRSADVFARNRALLQDTVVTQSYIDNALVPLVQALADHPAAIAWEIFNEPEGMTTQFGWTPQRVGMADVQRFVNRTAGAIHRAHPGAVVTNGSWSFRASSDRLPNATPAEFNYYSDARLVAAGGDPDGTLDYYTVHYYEWGQTRLSPFHHDASYWGLDKPVVVAEFFLADTQDGNADAVYGVPSGDLYETLYDRGYAGALAWQWWDWWTNRQPERANWPRAVENMAELFALHPEAVDVVPGGVAAEPEPGIDQGLRESAPNPFDRETTLHYTLRAPSHVRLDVFDIVGRRVAVLVDGPEAAGNHAARFDGTALPAGVYVARLQSEAGVQTRRVVKV